MSQGVEFDPNFDEKLSQLDDQIEDLILDLMNLAEITFEDGQEYEACKKYIKDKMNQSILHICYRMQRARIFDRDINP